MRKKLLSMVMVATFATTTLAPITVKAIDFERMLETNIVEKEKNEKEEMVKKISKTLSKEGITEKSSKQNVELLLVSDGSDITKELEALNATVYRASTSVYLVNITAENAYKLSEINAVKSVGKNSKISLTNPIDNKLIDIPKKNTDGTNPKMEYCHEVTGIKELWKKGYDGKGMKVAIVDTGVEASNEMFTCTTDGKLKIVDYKDFYWTHPRLNEMGEGDAKLQEIAVENQGSENYVEFEGRKISLPKDIGKKVLIGYYQESSYLHKKEVTADVNNNNKLDDKFLIVVSNHEDNIYGDNFKYTNIDNDKIYVDTNLNGSLLDEIEMNVYREGAKKLKDDVIFDMNDGNLVLGENNKPVVKEQYREQYKKLYNSFKNNKEGKNAEGTSYDFVISDVYNKTINQKNSWYINLGFDANSHGTHVAGEAAGNGYEKLDFVNKKLQPDSTIKGTAPGAQLMAIKVGQYHGQSYTLHQMSALEYASEQGADVINLSIGGEEDINDGKTEPISVLIDQLTKKYGVIVSKSAGNAGPRINSTGGGAAGQWSFSVGAYNAGWLNYKYPDVQDCLWDFSSNGPTEDGRFKPDFIAPGSQISAFPNWHQEEVRAIYDGTKGTSTVGHGLMQGTSQASPYTGGVVTVLRQAIKELKIPYHPLILQEALINSGNKTINNKIYRQAEIGGGLIQPVDALAYLENLKNNGLDKIVLQNADNSFVERNKLYVLSKFNYTEKLTYKPEGLYVRSGDIPDSVKVTLKNDKDMDMNLDLQKDSYDYSNDWLTLSESTINIPKGTSKVITLFIDKSKLNKDLNCANIVMDDKSTPLRDGVIPVTVVNYMDLTPENPEQSEMIQRDLPIEQVQKHFVRVPAGAKELKFTIEKLDPSEHTRLYTYITDPSGLNDEENGFSVESNYKSETFSVPASKIVSGTWEISVKPRRSSFTIVGNDAMKAKNRYKFTARVDGKMISPNIINFEGTVGKEVSQKITVSSASGVKVKGLNLINSDLSQYPVNITEILEMKDKKSAERMFTIDKNNPNYVTNITITDMKGSNDNLILALFKIVGDDFKLITRTTKLGANQKLSMNLLPDGEYIAYVQAEGTGPKCKLEIQTINSSDGTIPLTLTESSGRPINGVQAFDAKITLPMQVGKFLGSIIATDTYGNIVSRIPVNVTTKANVITKKVEINKINMPEQFTAGQKATVKIEVENLQNNINQDATLIVGLYDKNNKLVQLDKAQVNLTPNQIKEITAGEVITIPTGEGYVVRCFVWDSVDKMNPLQEIIQIPVK